MYILDKCKMLVAACAVVSFTFNILNANAEQTETTDLMVVFDASGSMWGQIDGRSKIEIARKVFDKISIDWVSKSIQAGLIAYGHRKKGDCSDIELISTPSAHSTTTMAQSIRGLSPKGKTPISASLQKAADILKFTENKATVILLSDGIETCHQNACDIAKNLENLGVNFTAHVIGLGITKNEEQAQLQCIAQSTGGQYFDARDAGSLNEAFTEVVQISSNDEESGGTIDFTAKYKLIDGVARPAWVEYEAVNLDNAEIISFKRAEQTEQIIQGQKMSLSPGQWKITLHGDAGYGEMEVNLTDETEFVEIPYSSHNATFEFLDKGPFLVGTDFPIRIKALQQLEENATYTMWIFPENPTSFDQRLTYFSRFGSDQGITEHTIWAGEGNYPVGNYEIIIKNGSDYDLDNNLGRFKFSLVEELSHLEQKTEQAINSAKNDVADQIWITLQYLDGSAPQGQTHWSILKRGDLDVRAPVTLSSRSAFDDIEFGTYDIEASIDTQTGLALAKAELKVEANGPREFVIIAKHETNGHDSVSTESTQINNQLMMDIWKRCENADAPCTYQDRRVDLVWTLPPDWVTEEPYYYATAGGAQAVRPTTTMATRPNETNPFYVTLNPRQWDQSLGPCIKVKSDQVCRSEYSAANDEADFQLILAGLKETAFGSPLSEDQINHVLNLLTETKS